MNWRAKRRFTIFVLLFFVLPLSSMGADGKSVRENPPETPWNHDLGIILNTHSLIFDIDSYKGGIGAKISLGSYMLRGAADLLFNTGFNPLSVTLGVAMEKHFLPGPISPYWGLFVDAGFIQLKTETDAENWTRQITLPFTVGPLLGIEIFIFDFLSVFVEFSLPLTLGIETTQTSVAGSVTSSSKFIYRLDLGLSDQSMLGIVIYLTRKKLR